MPIWSVTEEGPERVARSSLRKERLLEEKLEGWIAADPSILGESLLLVGRQVTVPEVNDRLDLLALDTQGNAVVIEVKRGQLKEPVDMQALRYASYLARWSFEDFERVAKAYYGGGKGDFNFNGLYEEFCSEAGIDEPPDINTDQKIVIIGSEVRDKLGSVALWLLEHNINIRVIELECYRENQRLLIQPNVIVPPPVNRFAEIGRIPSDGNPQPWDIDGKSWHLKKRCGAKNAELLLQIDEIVRETVGVDPPRWNQKLYIAYWVTNRIWLSIGTQANMLTLTLNAEPGAFEETELASRLSVEVFDTGDPLAVKLGLRSSVTIQAQNGRDQIVLRVKEEFSPDTDAFRQLLKDAFKAFPKREAVATTLETELT